MQNKHRIPTKTVVPVFNPGKQRKIRYATSQHVRGAKQHRKGTLNRYQWRISLQKRLQTSCASRSSATVCVVTSWVNASASLFPTKKECIIGSAKYARGKDWPSQCLPKLSRPKLQFKSQR
eukprot:4400792-Amphidinium_carterae.1